MINPEFLSFGQFKGVYTSDILHYYMHTSLPGAATSDAVWVIQRVDFDANGNILTIKYPQNSSGNPSNNAVFAADNYASYTYGP